MRIRNYQPGDETAQAQIYNTAAGCLPRFKPATAEEIARRNQAAGFRPSDRFYAELDGQTVGYAGFDRNGRISFPWTLPGFEKAREPLLDAVLHEMTACGVPEAWAAYRGDWTEVLDFFTQHGFDATRTMINYAADRAAIAEPAESSDLTIASLDRDGLAEVARRLDPGAGPVQFESLERFYRGNPYFDDESLYVVRKSNDPRVRGVAMLVVRPGYADPAQVDPAMPCFRLGAFGTEHQRHKRINGMFSCLFETPADGEVLLAEALRRLESAGLDRIAAQAPSDRPELVAFSDRHFQRQGEFPIVSRGLGEVRS